MGGQRGVGAGGPVQVGGDARPPAAPAPASAASATTGASPGAAAAAAGATSGNTKSNHAEPALRQGGFRERLVSFCMSGTQSLDRNFPKCCFCLTPRAAGQAAAAEAPGGNLSEKVHPRLFRNSAPMKLKGRSIPGAAGQAARAGAAAHAPPPGVEAAQPALQAAAAGEHAGQRCARRRRRRRMCASCGRRACSMESAYELSVSTTAGRARHNCQMRAKQRQISITTHTCVRTTSKESSI